MKVMNHTEEAPVRNAAPPGESGMLRRANEPLPPTNIDPLRPDTDLAVEVEILKEKACALGNAGHRLQKDLDQLQALLRELKIRIVSQNEGVDRDELEKGVAEFNQLVLAARESRRRLMIHREASGFRGHELVAEAYPIPTPLTEDQLVSIFVTVDRDVEP